MAVMDRLSRIHVESTLGEVGYMLVSSSFTVERTGFCFIFLSLNLVILFTLRNILAGLGLHMLVKCGWWCGCARSKLRTQVQGETTNFRLF